jgi:hypothetical protein
MNSSSVQNTVEFGAIRRELELAENPLNSAALSKRLKQKSGKAFKPTLDEEVRAGRIYSWGDRYWDRNPRDVARERLLRVTASELLTADPLNKRVAPESPKIKQNVVIDVREEMVREGSLRKVAQRGSKSTAKWIVNVSHPEPYLEFEIGRLLADFGIERSTERILALLAPAEPQPQVEVQTGTEPDVGEIAKTMFAMINRIAFAPGTTVTFYHLRQQPELASVPKPIFDKAALLLQQNRKALLAVHDHAARLPQSEQDELVTDGLGNYYVSIYTL